MLVGLSNFPCYADEGLVFPGTAQVRLSAQLNDGTLVAVVDNLATDPVTGMYCTLLTSQPVDIVMCKVDGATVSSPQIESVFGSVYPDKYTTRWIVESFSSSIELTCQQFSGHLSVSGVQTYPFFGIIAPIGSPNDLEWVE